MGNAPSKAKQLINVGDILFSNVRVYLKNVAIVSDNKLDNQVCSTGFTVLRVNKQCSVNKFLFYFLLLDSVINKISEYQTGSSYPAIKSKDLLNLIIPLPPLHEQEEIVRRVEKQFAIADKIEEQYKEAMERVEKLEQAILAKAFRGELDEPDPNDEPAELLLKNILNEKEKIDLEKNSKKKKKRTTKKIKNKVK